MVQTKRPSTRFSPRRTTAALRPKKTQVFTTAEALDCEAETTPNHPDPEYHSNGGHGVGANADENANDADEELCYEAFIEDAANQGNAGYATDEDIDSSNTEGSVSSDDEDSDLSSDDDARYDPMKIAEVTRNRTPARDLGRTPPARSPTPAHLSACPDPADEWPQVGETMPTRGCTRISDLRASTWPETSSTSTRKSPKRKRYEEGEVSPRPVKLRIGKRKEEDGFSVEVSGTASWAVNVYTGVLTVDMRR